MKIIKLNMGDDIWGLLTMDNNSIETKQIKKDIIELCIENNSIENGYWEMLEELQEKYKNVNMTFHIIDNENELIDIIDMNEVDKQVEEHNLNKNNVMEVITEAIKYIHNNGIYSFLNDKLNISKVELNKFFESNKCKGE